MKEAYFEIIIDQIESKGKGSGPFIDSSSNEKRAEIPFTMPGDRVETRLKRKRNGVYPGPLLKILEPSPQRIEAKCPHFGSCGGCAWQQIPYNEQLKLKEQFVKRVFREIDCEAKVFCSIVPAHDPWSYRNKMEFSFSEDAKKEKYLGLFLTGSRGKVFNLEQCYLTSSWFPETLKQVREWWQGSSLTAYNPRNNRGSLRTLTLRESITIGQKMAMLTVSGNPEDALHQNDLNSFKALFPENISLFLRIHQAIKGQPTQFFEMHLQGPESIEETLHGLRFSISPSSFFQPNTLQAMQLYEIALKLANLSSSDVVYDLFCGTGTLGILASRHVKKVIGIELSEESSLDGRTNVKLNQIDNVEIITGDVGAILETRKDLEKPTVILLDPPRAGLSQEALNHVLAFKCKTVVYVSCNPVSQAKDIKEFLKAGYQLKTVQPVDQFPQTIHIESVVLLCLPS